MYWKDIQWKPGLLTPLSYDGHLRTLLKRSLKQKEDRRERILEKGSQLRIMSTGRAGKVSDCGYDQFRCIYTALPSDTDFLFEADVRVAGFLREPGPTNREAFGIFIRDTMDRDPLTGLFYSNMAAVGGYYGRYNFYGREGLRAEDNSCVHNFTMYRKIDDPGGGTLDSMHYAVPSSDPAVFHLALMRSGDTVFAKMEAPDGSNLLDPDKNGGIEELAGEGNVHCGERPSVRLPEAFRCRDPKYLYIGFLTTDAEMCIDKESVRIQLLSGEGRKPETHPAREGSSCRLSEKKNHEADAGKMDADPGKDRDTLPQSGCRGDGSVPCCPPDDTAYTCVLHVSADGSPSGDGSPDRPYDLQTAVQCCPPGGLVRLKAGKYLPEQPVIIRKEDSGDGRKRKYLSGPSSPDEKAVLDFGGSCHDLRICGDYWTIENICVSRGYGIRIEGSHNCLNRCVSCHNLETGILIRHPDNFSARKDWPRENTVDNCISFDNRDPSECNADGFACKVAAGTGNIFRNCLSFLNSDDGFDLYSKNRKTGRVRIENCQSFLNGFKRDRNGGLVPTAGNGTGFKLGGSGLYIEHTAVACLAEGNRRDGIRNNSNPYFRVERCTSKNNGNSNILYSIYYCTGAKKYKKIIGCSTGYDPDYDPQALLKKLLERCRI